MKSTKLECLGSLKDELDSVVEMFGKMAPIEVLEIIFEHIKRLAATEITELSLKEGDLAPDFLLPDTSGQMVSSVDLRAKGPIVVIFFRGGWCDFCQTTLRMIRRYTPMFEARGATVVGISPQTIEYNEETAKKAGLSFPILADDHNEYAQECHLAYEVDDAIRPIYQSRNLTESQGNDSWVLPIPASYVIETDGRVTYSYVDVDFTKRAEPVDILNALPPLRKNKRDQLRDKLQYKLAKLQDTLPGKTFRAFLQSTENIKATGIAEKAVRRGDTAPDFRLKTGTGEVCDSKRLRRNGPLVVIFYQGNVFCEITLAAMQSFLSKFEAKGASVVAVSPQTPEAVAKMATACRITFPLLLDRDNEVAKAFRIAYDMDPAIADTPFGTPMSSPTSHDPSILPLTATYVIDTDGTVLYAFVGCDLTRRAEPARVLAAVPSKKIAPKRKRGPFSMRLGRWLPFQSTAVRVR